MIAVDKRHPTTLVPVLTLIPHPLSCTTHRAGDESSDPWDFPGTVRVSSNNQEGEVMDMLSEHTYTPSLNSTAMVTEPQGTSNGTALDNSEEIGERHGQQPQPTREKEEEEEQRELESAVAISRRPESQNLSSVVLPVLDQVSLQWFVIHSVATLIIIITFGRMTTLLLLLYC